jgi:phosphonoacetate hydrolase
VTGTRPSRLLLMAWDGMRPDLISAELTPNLAALGARGVVFDANHAIVPTVTRINAATLATGAPPAAHGLPANVFLAPTVDPSGPISVGEGDNVAQLRAAYGVFAAPTISDAVHAAGGRTVIVSSGTRGCAQMLHPRRREAGDLILHPTLSTDDELRPFVERLGPMPEADVPDTARNRWLGRAAAEIVIPELRPDVLLFWHDDPDKTQHMHGFGHLLSLQSIRAADEHLGIVLAGLDAAGVREETLVVIASDHGYVGIRERVDFSTALAAVEGGDRVVVAPNGCSALVYVEQPDDRLVARVAAALRQLAGTGVIFTGARGGAVVDGTLPLRSIEMDGPLAPDLLVTLDWSDDLNEHSHQGVSAGYSSSNRASHGGASAWEIRNTLLFQGAGVLEGYRSSLPSGTIDIAPTVLTMLGLPIPESMTGRVLHEALVTAHGVGSGGIDDSPSGGTVERWDDVSAAGTLSWSRYGGHTYLDSARR